MIRTLTYMLHKLKMSNFSLLFMLMISSWCAIIGQAFASEGRTFSKHRIAVKHIFWYLQGILQFKLRLGGLPPQDLVGYCDANWAGDLEDKRSTTRFVFMMGDGAIFWSNKWQLIIILWMTKAEYMASTQTTKKAIWMTKLMKELGYMKEKKAMVIQCDNQGAISLTKNPT